MPDQYLPPPSKDPPHAGTGRPRALSHSQLLSTFSRPGSTPASDATAAPVDRFAKASRRTNAATTVRRPMGGVTHTGGTGGTKGTNGTKTPQPSRARVEVNRTRPLDADSDACGLAETADGPEVWSKRRRGGVGAPPPMGEPGRPDDEGKRSGRRAEGARALGDHGGTEVIEIGDDGSATTVGRRGAEPAVRHTKNPAAPERELFAAPPAPPSVGGSSSSRPAWPDRWDSRTFLRGGTTVRSTSPVPAATPADAKLPHLPALDGLRGLAVAGVLVFHGGFAWASGGFLGVSTFFTLSGFLITSLLLREHAATEHVNLGTFWIRRARRLLPAALASLLLAQIITLAIGDAGQRKGLGVDTIGALLYGANWRSVFAGQSYGALFEAPSPLLHFWSLAVEEQFYLFYPLLVFGVLGLLRWNRQRFIALLATLTAASIVLMVFVGPALGWSIDRLYYGTDTRMAELLAGALLAACIAHRVGKDGLRARRAATVPIASLGAIALVFMLVMWTKATHESVWIYRGGLALYALATVAVVAACVVPFGPVRAVLATTPLQWLGRISYGVYLYHWPVFLLLNPSRTHLDGWPLFLLRLAVTFPIAMASYRWLEMPFRRGAALRTVHVKRVGPFVVGSLVLVGCVVATSAPEKANDFAANQRKFDEARARATATTVATDPSSSAPSGGIGVPLGRVPRMAVFGDSTALSTGIGLGDHYAMNGQVEPVGAGTELGCGIGRGGERRGGTGAVEIPDRCNQWETTWPDTMRSTGADLALVQIGPWDVKERKLPGDSEWRTMGDPVYDAFLLSEMTKAVDVLSADGAHVVWLTTPPVTDAARNTDQAEWREPPPVERVDRFNALVAQLPQLRPGKVAVVDLAAWLANSGRDATFRPDGVHLSDDQARVVASEHLAQAVYDADASLAPAPPTTAPGRG